MPKTKSKKKPKRPKGSPLAVNGNGQWSKKSMESPFTLAHGMITKALKKYTDLIGGKPRQVRDTDSVTLEELVMLLLTAYEKKVESGAREDRTFQDLKQLSGWSISGDESWL